MAAAPVLQTRLHEQTGGWEGGLRLERKLIGTKRDSLSVVPAGLLCRHAVTNGSGGTATPDVEVGWVDPRAARTRSHTRGV